MPANFTAETTITNAAITINNNNNKGKVIPVLN
jgi:hypothetical protein